MTHFDPGHPYRWRTGLTIRVLVAASLLFIAAVQAEIVGQSSDELLVTKRATQDHIVAPRIFEFSIADFRYLVLNNGDGVRIDSRDNSSPFALPLDDTDIEQLDYLDTEGDPIIIYVVTNVEESWGSVIRLDKKTLVQKWLAHVPGFNIGEAVVKDHWLYLSAIGFVGKLDLDSGNYVWQYKGLYNKKPGLFNSFERPVIDQEVVKFTERLPYGEGEPVTIVVVDSTGRIISPQF